VGHQCIIFEVETASLNSLSTKQQFQFATHVKDGHYFPCQLLS